MWGWNPNAYYGILSCSAFYYPAEGAILNNIKQLFTKSEVNNCFRITTTVIIWKICILFGTINLFVCHLDKTACGDLKKKRLTRLLRNNHLNGNQSAQRIFNNHLCNYTKTRKLSTALKKIWGYWTQLCKKLKNFASRRRISKYVTKRINSYKEIIRTRKFRTMLWEF